MKTNPSILLRTSVLSLVAFACLPGAMAQAETIVKWGGSENGDPTVGSNWVGGHRAQTGVSGASAESAEISSGSVLQTTNSLSVSYGNSLIIDGGSYTTATGITVTFAGSGTVGDGGSLIVSSGTFTTNAGFSFDTNSQFTISGGTVNAGGLVQLKGGTFSISSGVINSANDFILSSTLDSVTGGTVNVNYLGISGNAGNVLTLSGGAIITDRFGTAANTYVNFTPGSGGSLFLGYYTLANVKNFITAGQIRYNGIDNALAADDLANFVITAGTAGTNDGYFITLAVPEPSTVGLMSLSGLGMLVFWRRMRRS